MDARDEHVDEYLRDFFESFLPPLFSADDDDDDDFVTELTNSCSAMRCGGVMRLIDTCFTSWKVVLWESVGRLIHSFSTLKNKNKSWSKRNNSTLLFDDLHFSRTPSDLKLILAIHGSPLANDASLKSDLNIATAHNFLRLFQFVLQHVHHAYVEEVKATSCVREKTGIY
jgi:hypothetical protein